MTVNTGSNSDVAKNSAVIMSAQVLGIIAGVGFDVLTAATYGIGLEMDAFFIALTIPQVIVSVFVSVSIRSLSPLFLKTHEEDGSEKLVTLLSSTINLMLLLLAGIAGVGIIVAPVSVILLTPGLSAESRKMVVPIARILYLSLLPLAIVEPLRSYFIFQKRFFLATLSNFLRYAVAFVTLLVLRQNGDILALGWAYVAGAFVQAIVYGSVFLSLGGKYKLTLGRNIGALRLVSARIGPPLIGELIGQSNILVERFFGSFLSPGFLSALGYGRRFIVVSNSLIANSVSVAILPRLSIETISKNKEQIRRTILFGTKLIVFLTGTGTLTLISLSYFLIMLLFQRGSFDAKATAMTATILSIFAPALVFQGLTQFFMVPFFASGKTKLIMYFRILFLGLNFVVSFVLFQLMGGYGLAAALPVSTCLQAIIWLFLLSVELEGLDREFYAFLVKFLSILALISLGFYFSVGWISRIDNIYLLIGFNGLLLLFGYLVFILLTMKTGLISTGDLSKIRAIFIKRGAASFPK